MTDCPDLTGTRLGNYRLVRLLGRGRMGVVYLAQDEALLRPTAVKVLSWAFLQSHGDRPEAWFLAEARSVARINHPGVVQVYGVARNGSYCYIAMEYVEGVSGEAMVAARGPLSPSDASRVILQIAGALDQAHLNNIVHRDVKPANILIRNDGSAKLGDFGMALHAASVTPGARLPIGTPYYMAPEIWQGGSATALTDIYALGAAYFYLLTGRPPFGNTDLRSLVNCHLQAAVPDPATIVATIPPGCARIVSKCMAKSPRERYQAAQEVEWDLRGLLRHLHGRTVAAADATPSPFAGETAADAPTSGVPEESWVAVLGLGRRPFSTVSSGRCPYEGEPLCGVREQLRSFIRREPGEVMLLTGEQGCGSSTLVRQALADVNAQVAYLDLKQDLPPGRSLTQWACQAVGALPSTSTGRDAALEGLVEHLSENAQSAVFGLDSVVAGAPYMDALLSLVRAARSTRCMSLVVVGSAELAEHLGGMDTPEAPPVAIVPVPSLDARQTTDYLAAWLQVTRRPGVPRLLVTPDAALLVFHRTKGNLAKINSIATNMLRMAAFENRRVLSSSYAWLAPMMEVWTPATHARLLRVPGWPPDEVVRVVNDLRQQAGIPLRPRGPVQID